MAQYYGDEERSQSQLGGPEQEMPPVQRDHEGRSDDRKSEVQAEGYNMYSGEPENATYKKEEVPGDRSVDASADERDGAAPYPLGNKRSGEFGSDSDHIEGKFEKPAEEEDAPKQYEGEEDRPSGVYEQSRSTGNEFKESDNEPHGGEVNENAGYANTAENPTAPDRAGQREYSEDVNVPKQYEGEEDIPSDVYEQSRSTGNEFKESDNEPHGGEVNENAVYASTAENPTAPDRAGQREYSEDVNVPNQDVSTDQGERRSGYEESPYTQAESKEDYDKRAYGGGFRSKTEGEDHEERADEPNPEQQQQTEGTERGFSFPKTEENEERESEGQKPKGNIKEKVKETLIPCHKTETLDDEDSKVDGATKSPGFVEKMKEKFSSGKPHDTTPHDEAANSPPKKNAIDKLKEKFSPSSN